MEGGFICEKSMYSPLFLQQQPMPLTRRKSRHMRRKAIRFIKPLLNASVPIWQRRQVFLKSGLAR